MAFKMIADNGEIYIEQDVVAKIAGLSAMGCYGVVGMAAKSTSDGLFSLLKIDTITKGVKISAKNAALIVDLFIIVEFGVNIAVISESIINNVSYSIEEYTGLKVSKINVNVEGVRVE